MPYGQTSWMSISTYVTGFQEQLSLTGNIAFCKRPQAVSPKWVLIATDIGEIRVFDKGGAHKPEHDINLGWAPSQVEINNEDTPRILIRRQGTLAIYCYRSGAELWNVAGIASLLQSFIGTAHVVVLLNTGVAGTVGPQWRSPTDGSITQAARGGSTTNAKAGAINETGSDCVWQNTNEANGTTYLRRDEKTTGNKWNVMWYGSSGTTTTDNMIMASGDLNLLITTVLKTSVPYTRGMAVYNGATGAQLWSGTYSTAPALGANPAGTRVCAIQTNTLEKWNDVGTRTTVVLGANKGASRYSCDISDDPFFNCALNNGNIEIYNDALTKVATISYGYADTPLAVVRRLS